MNRLLSFFIGCSIAVAATAQSSPYKGVAPDDLINGDYYLYNVRSGLWLGDNYTNTQRYTSRAELGKRGIDVAIKRSGDGWQLDPKLGHNHSINAGNLYMDTGEALTVWNITPVEGDIANGVKLTSGEYTLGADADGLITNKATGSDTWQLVTRMERMAVDSSNASEAAPADLSWAVYGATFPIADDRRMKWQGAWGSNNVGGDGVYRCNRVWEMWGIKWMEVYQELSGLPDGKYAVSAQAIFSPTPNSEVSVSHLDAFLNGSEPTKGYVFAGDQRVPMENIYNLVSGESKTNYNTKKFDDNRYMPDGMQQIANHMFDGRGLTGQAIVTVTDGKLRLGVGVEGGAEKAWILFDNFNLYYLGKDASLPEEAEESAKVTGVEYRKGDRAHLCISFDGTADMAFEHGVAGNVTVSDAAGNVVAYGTSVTNCYDNEWHHTDVRLTLSKELPAGDYTLNIPANSLLLKELGYGAYRRPLSFGFNSSECVAGDGDNDNPMEELAVNQTYADGVRIAWRHNSQRYIGGGSYGRVRRLSDGTYVMVYSTGGSNIGGDNFIRWQDEPYGNWTSAKVSMPGDSWHTNKNAEIYELKDGRLMYAWLYRTNYNSSRGPSKIMAAYSSDGGRTWENEQVIYTATDTYGYGVWEPAMLQLPSGELQIYFANEASAPGGSQNISMRRSFNGGRSWEPGTEIVAYRNNSRDGMPVPVYLKNRKGIAVAIEDPGFMGRFKPMIVHTDADDNWASGQVDGGSKHRWPIFGSSSEYLASDVYCGQPYVIQLNTGETIYSAASGEDRDPITSDTHGRMAVYVGDDNAKNFIARSFPFPFATNSGARAIWNSIMQYNDSTLLAVCTVEGSVSKSGIWTSEGIIMRPIVSLQTGSTQQWEKLDKNIFIGSESQAEARFRSMWDNDCLYYRVNVKDNSVHIAENASDTDGVELLLSPGKPRSLARTNSRRYRIGVDGTVTIQAGSGAKWVAVDPDGTKATVKTVDGGYEVTVAIPWEAFGGKPSTEEMYCCYMLHNIDIVNGRTVTVHETLSGSNIDKNSTWMRMPLKADPSVGIVAVGADATAKGASRQYNLLGQPVGANARGIIIVDGKKVVRK